MLPDGGGDLFIIHTHMFNLTELKRQLDDANEKIKHKDTLLDEKRALLKDAQREHEHEMKALRSEHQIAMNEREAAHELTCRDLENKLKHKTSDEVEALKRETVRLSEKVAVQAKELEMFNRIIKTDKNVLDVKNIVSELMKKLPNVDLKNFNVTAMLPPGQNNDKK